MVWRSIAVENARGWRIAKEKSSHKIDVVVALAQAALAAVQNGEQGWMRVGGINVSGEINWHEPESQQSRIRWITVDELGEPLRPKDEKHGAMTQIRHLSPALCPQGPNPCPEDAPACPRRGRPDAPVPGNSLPRRGKP